MRFAPCCIGRQADGIRLCEQALAVDPLVEQARRVLIRTYLDLEDPVAAEQLADASRGDEAVPRAFMALYRRDWTAAGEAAYEALERGTEAPDNAGLMYAAIRLHARTTGDVARAIAAIEPHARVEWDGAGKPALRDSSALRDGAIALADLLILDGQVERGRRLLAEIIGTMERETRGEGRPEFWYLRRASSGARHSTANRTPRSRSSSVPTPAGRRPAHGGSPSTRSLPTMRCARPVDSKPCAARFENTSPKNAPNSSVCARKAWSRCDRAASSKRRRSSAAAFARQRQTHGRLCWCSASENLT